MTTESRIKGWRIEWPALRVRRYNGGPPIIHCATDPTVTQTGVQYTTIKMTPAAKQAKPIQLSLR